MNENAENINNQVGSESETPQLLEGVANVRKCSFKPEEHFIQIGFQNSDEKSYYLEVKWRAFWFQTYCEEHGITSFSIEELPVSLIAGTTFLQATCLVKINGDIVGQGVGGYNLAGNDIEYAIQQASTIAKGRALANAGFGTVFSSAIAKENGGYEIACDGGLRTSEFFVQRNPSNPMQIVTPAPASADDSVPDPKPAPKEMTRQEALRFTVPIRGKNFGVPLGELYAKDPGAVSYYAENARYKNSELQTAAKLVLNR